MGRRLSPAKRAARKVGRGVGRGTRNLFTQMGDELRRDLGALFGLGAACFLLYALFGSSAGVVGDWTSRLLRYLLGLAAPALPVLWVGLALARLLRLSGKVAVPRLAGAVLGLLTAASYLEARAAEPVTSLGWLLGQGGGMVGAAGSNLLGKAFGDVGRGLVLAVLGLASLIMVGNVPLGQMARRAAVWVAGAGRRAAAGRLAAARPEAGRAAMAGPGLDAMDLAAADPLPVEEEDDVWDATAVEDTATLSAEAADAASADAAREGSPSEPLPPGDPTSPAGYQQIPLDSQPYAVPPLTLLSRRGARGSAAEAGKESNQKRRILEDTLKSFGVDARVVDVLQGPTVTRFEVQPAPGVKVARIASLSDDIALALAAGGVRIVAPIPGKAAIGIEVPNNEIATVFLRDVLESREFQQTPNRLPVALGQDISGRPIVSALEKMVHVLIAGATGSGKSVCVNGLLTSLLFKAGPEQLKLLLIDPKVVELSVYNGIPHLISPVVTDPRKAAGCLRWALKEMERRYESFAHAGVRDIARFNQAALLKGERQLPYIVVVIDELADLMMVAPVEVEDAIQRLAQMARAAGIHMVVATQRPSVDVITGVIKANIPSRIAFAVASQVDSRTILDGAGAEKLVGKGDMLFYPMGASKPLRVQGAYLPESELESVVDFIKHQGEPEYRSEVLEVAAQESPSTEAPEDDLLPAAIRVVLESGQASVSIIQRRLRVGYTRAGRLIDMMEERGIVGPHQGPKPREVLITSADYRRLFGDGV